MLRRHDIVCISSIDWDFNWQGHQEIMAALAAQGHRVLFLENTGVRVPRIRDWPRLRQRFRNWRRGPQGFREERPNLFVYSPLVLPLPFSRIALWINRTILLAALRRWMRAVNFGRPIVWTFLPTPLAVDLVDRLDPQLVLYYCIADFEELGQRPSKIAASERRLLTKADLVFVQGEELRQRCGTHPNVHIFPFGVSLSTFRRDVAPAPELQGLKRPIIGYVGGIHQYVDLGLIARLAGQVDGTVVLVGPQQVPVDGLRREPIVFAGAQPHARVPEFIRGFDVGIIPYTRSQYTETVYPTKLNEYLAMGIPVVATDLPELRKFDAEHPEVVEVVGDADAFVGAVRHAVEAGASEDVNRRVAVARQNSWETRIPQMMALMEQALAAREGAGRSWEEVFRRLYTTARRRVAWTVVPVLLSYVALFHTPFLWWIASPLRLVDQPRPADAIVVFAGGVGESGQAGGGYQERVAQAVELYRRGFATNLVFSSGFVFSLREAEVMKALAVSLGVRADAIIVEEQASNTHQNVVFVHRILQERGWDNILLVSSPYHMRRALLTWKKIAPDIQVISVPVPRSQFYTISRGARLTQVRGIMHEYAAILFYWWNGWAEISGRPERGV